MDISNISVVLGVLGAYFAILLVLSVSVETILEPFSFFKGLQKKVGPDEVLKTVQEWLPAGSDDAAKVVAIQTYAEKANVDLAELDRIAQEVAVSSVTMLSELGLESQVNGAHQVIAVKFSTLREKYAASQKQRITILRTLSAAVGIVIAFSLQINTFQILGELFSPEMQNTLASPAGQFGGMFLTGLAASAGSSFWYDMIGLALNIKDTMKNVESMTAKG